MIHRVYSDLESFKTIELRPGLNLLLADKSKGATDRQTRNGAGKTSFVEVVHFLSGGSCRKDSLLQAPPLKHRTFGLTFDLHGNRTTVERSAGKPSRIVVIDADERGWPEQPGLDAKLGHRVTTNVAWKRVLGSQMFGLDASEGDDDGPAATKGPTFRSVFAYFARKQMAGGFTRPEQQSAKQPAWNQQVAVTFLLGLDWTIPQRFEHVRERENALKELRKAVRAGTLGSVMGSSAELRTKVTLADAHVKRLREQLASFQVLPEYRELEREASELTVKVSTLSNENTLDEQHIAHVERAMNEEIPPPVGDLRRVYEEAGVALPGVALKRLDDVRQFHDSIVRNRRSHLQGELTTATKRIKEREPEMKALVARRAQIMTTLATHGALDHFTRLQSELTRIDAEAEALRQRLAAAEQLEGRQTELEIERAILLKRLQDDYREQQSVFQEAILTFEDLSNALYEKAGSLTVTPTRNGPDFAFTIDAARSKGITNMQIFCFDMMLMELWSRRGRGPGFLVHDSHLFDGVDARQVAKALQLGADRAQEVGFQYVVTMNSDAVPRSELPASFRLDDYVLPVRLTDATVDGGLFGLRFN
jgi:uncharacterized protein YydD (DUF2326 family)